MQFLTRTLFYIAMILLGIVSMWTTYQSLHDSILMEPVVRVNLGNGVIWDCSIFALFLSLAIGMMLFALKAAIIDGHKRLNVLGLIGLIVVGFISISFNLDVLYRVADRDFFMRYSTKRMKSVYENYLTEAQNAMNVKRETARKSLAKQEGELESEIRGLRQAPQGYGKVAKQEDYQLTLLQKTTEVELESIEQAMVKKEEADKLLRSALPKTIDEIEQMQSDLRVVIKDVGALSGKPLPEVVRTETPLFAVFSKLFDWRDVGIKEGFFVLLALLLDLGDIVGYSLIPNQRPPRIKEDRDEILSRLPAVKGPEVIPSPQMLQPMPQHESVAAAAFPDQMAAPLSLGVDSPNDNSETDKPRPRWLRRR